MTVGRLLGGIDSRELTEWIAYEQMTGPLGPARGDHQAAQITATLLNVNRGKRRRPRTISDVLMRWDDQEPVTPQELYAKAQQLNAAMGGTLREREPVHDDAPS
ncbi:phage tail assembly protein T [Streptosporangium sp. DT93]|uniref:phage tail assembly protein T n=1 Tax=Streptosporangium sp. DT93 TaxID=3393428 RepID=UPI003CF9FFF8